MNTSKSQTKDPICGMSVDPLSALFAEHNGQKFYFCGEPCRKKFLAAPDNARYEKKSGSCCGS